MNKLQLIVAWVIGIFSCVLLLRVYQKPIYLRLLGEYSKAYWKSEVWFYLVVVLIIGGLLIYTLRDKKK
jgi:DMSO reductase anchor subunit